MGRIATGGAMTALLWILYLIVAITSAFVAASIAARKSRPAPTFFVLGLAFSVIAVIAARFVSPGAPAGTRPVVCPRCNARQNIPAGESHYECWQCKASTEASEPVRSPLNLTDQNLTTVQRALTLSICAFLAVGFVAAWFDYRSDRAEMMDFLILDCYRDTRVNTAGDHLPDLEACEQKINPGGGSPRVALRKQQIRDFDACAKEAFRNATASTNLDHVLDECYERERNQG